MAQITDGSAYSLFRKLKRERKPPPGEWRALSSKDPSPAEMAGGFQEAMVAGLPEAARRWLLRAIHQGTALAHRVELDLVGEISPDAVHGVFQVRLHRTLSPPLRSRTEGSARQGWRWLRVEEELALGAARQRFLLLGFLPVVQQEGPEFSQSAQELLALESIWLPSALLPHRGVTWKEVGRSHAAACLTLGGRRLEMTLTVAEDGSLRGIELPRLRNLPDGRWAPGIFRLQVEDETPYGGYTIPSVVRAGWTDLPEAALRLSIDSAHFS
jgi:hypothetical protein